MRVLRASLGLTLALTALVAFALGALAVEVLPLHVGAITIDSVRVGLDDLGVREWLPASGGAFIAVLAVLLIWPLVGLVKRLRR
jgi:hypothetical protein